MVHWTSYCGLQDNFTLRYNQEWANTRIHSKYTNFPEVSSFAVLHTSLA